MANDESNERLDQALEWCKKHKLESDRLDLFNRGRKKKSKKPKNRYKNKLFKFDPP